MAADESQMTELDCERGKLPMEETLCVFKGKLVENLFVLGWITFDESHKKFMVKEYGKQLLHDAILFRYYQPVLNEKGGYYFPKNFPKKTS